MRMTRVSDAEETVLRRRTEEMSVGEHEGSESNVESLLSRRRDIVAVLLISMYPYLSKSVLRWIHGAVHPIYANLLGYPAALAADSVHLPAGSEAVAVQKYEPCAKAGYSASV